MSYNVFMSVSQDEVDFKTCCPDTYCLRVSSRSGASNVSELGVSERTYRSYCLLRIAIEPSAGLQHVWFDQHQHCMPSLKSHAWLPKMSDPRPSLHLPVGKLRNSVSCGYHFRQRPSTNGPCTNISSCMMDTFIAIQFKQLCSCIRVAVHILWSQNLLLDSWNADDFRSALTSNTAWYLKWLTFLATDEFNNHLLNNWWRQEKKRWSVLTST